MNISPFDQSRNEMKDQYSEFYERADKEGAKALYAQMKRIYEAEGSKAVGFGKAVKHYFENVELYVNPADIFADMANEAYSPLSLRNEEYRKRVSLGEHILQAEGAIVADADFGHTMPDWNTVLELGITGILENAELYLKDTSVSPEQRDFYLSVKYAYEGVLIYIDRLRAECEATASENARFSVKNLSALLNGRPKTTAEAMQLCFIYHSAQYLTQGNALRSLGALDDLLYPFYKHDLDNGVCTEGDVRELVRYFLFKFTSKHIVANMPFNLATHTNDLTYLILEEYIALNVPDPKIHVKCSSSTPKRVYETIMRSIRNGNNSFVFVNDGIVKKALVKVGIEPQDAEDYTLIGCYEASASGKELPCTLNGRINMPMAVEAVLNNGKRFASDKVIGNGTVSDITALDDFEKLFDAVKAQLGVWVTEAMTEINEIERQYPSIIQSPILSATYEDCMKKGRDAYHGGAKYNNSSICIFGIGTIVDELIAIKKAVYEEKTITLSELVSVLKSNWRDNEKLRMTMRSRYPKYGNNIPEVDELALELTEYMSKCINGKPNGRGGAYRMGIFSIDWIIDAGKRLGASADGRYAGEPVSKNLSPSVGTDKNGVTGIINSVTKLDFTNAPNGAVLDLHLHPTAVSGDEGVEIMISVLNTYFKKGGYAVHFNVIDPETLKAAQKDPERYKNLQVRLCGWNVYFTDLDADMQNDLIASMETR